MNQISKIINLLTAILSESESRKKTIKTFQEEVWQGQAAFNERWVEEMLSDLAYDLDFYESDSARRQEDPAFFGDDKLELEVARILAKMIEFSRSKNIII